MNDSEQIVHRSILLRGLCDEGDAGKMLKLEGVQRAICKGKHLQLSYDVRQINLSTIESQLRKTGLSPKSTLTWRIKRAFYRYVDDNIRVTSGSSEASCCSSPHDIYARRRHEK